MKNKKGYSFIELIIYLLFFSLISFSSIHKLRLNQTKSETEIIKLFIERQLFIAFESNQQILIICEQKKVKSDFESIDLKYSNIDCGDSIFWVSPQGAISPKTIKISNFINECFLTISLRGRINKICKKE